MAIVCGYLYLNRLSHRLAVETEGIIDLHGLIYIQED